MRHGGGEPGGLPSLGVKADHALSRLQRRLDRERAARKEAEAIAEKGLRELYESQQRVQLLQRITEGANRLDDFRAALFMALEEICTTTHLDFGNAYVVDETGLAAHSCNCSYVGSSERVLDFAELPGAASFRSGEDLPGRVLATRAPQWFCGEDLGLGPDRAALARAAGIQSSCAFPIRVRAEVVAVIEIFARRQLAEPALPLAIMEQIGIQLGRVQERAHGRSLLHDTLHDPLTGLSNRVHLAKLSEEAFAAMAPSRAGMAMLVIDLDGFKQVNDRHGHAAGDKMLASIARRIRQALKLWLQAEEGAGRACDGIVARTGGDEFVVLLARIGRQTDLDALCEQLHAAARAPLLIGTQLLEPGVSIGLALSGPSQATVDMLQRDADLAMYEAKSCGSGRTVRYSLELGRTVRSRQALENELIDAIRERQFSLWYQPVYSIGGETRLAGFEALLRWNHPSKGLILPGRFISLAERLGHIHQFGGWILGEACEAALRLRAKFPGEVRPPSISVNIAPQQFLQKDFARSLTRKVEGHGLDPHAISLEVTERVAVIDVHRTAEVLSELRDGGIRTLLDDFGTGYSSLSYLKMLPFDVLKIDRSFVQGLDEPRTLSIVRAIFDLARGLHLTVLGEGVETRRQEATLRALGCELGQGFFYGQPMVEREAFALATAAGEVGTAA